jgi:DNA repair protein RadC
MSSITAWAESDRPREKMLLKGTAALSDSELLAILIGSGTVGESAVALAQRMLENANHSLHDLGRKTIKEFQHFKGIGEAKSITIAAALEIGRRRQMSDMRQRPRVTCSRDGYNVIAPMLTDLYHEEFWVLLLNQNNEVLDRRLISSGGMAATIVDMRVFFRAAIEGKAVGVIAVHNHPSGSLKPSQADISLTQKLVQAGKIVEIPVLDHLIVSEKGYFSFADEGLL